MKRLKSSRVTNAPAAKRSNEPEMGAPAAAAKTTSQRTGYPYCCKASTKKALNNYLLPVASNRDFVPLRKISFDTGFTDRDFLVVRCCASFCFTAGAFERV